MISPDRLLGVRVYDHRLWDVPSGQALLIRLIMVLFNGSAAVSLFFVLSGFVLALSLRRDKRALPVKGWAFLLRRFIRIYPSLAINILLIFVAVAVIGRYLPGLSLPQFSALQLRDNLLLQEFPINGATWSLMIELVAIPFIFFGFCISERWGLKGLLALMLAATVAIFAKVFLFHLLIDEFAFMFFGGMVVAELWLEQKTLDWRTTIRMIAIAVPVLLLARSILGQGSKYSELVEGYAATVFVAAVVLGPRFALHGILETRTRRSRPHILQLLPLSPARAVLGVCRGCNLRRDDEPPADWLRGDRTHFDRHHHSAWLCQLFTDRATDDMA
jgi:peptidoglycan/LPS O-acetylase OafA/YrhL